MTDRQPPFEASAKDGPRHPHQQLVAATILGASAVVAAALFVRSRSSQRPEPSAEAHPDHALQTYLLDHLTGSDAAFRVVGRLRRSQAGTREGELFAQLHDEFREERAIVKMLITTLGGSATSLKRVVGQATGGALSIAAGGRQGGLALFRTLESLAIGIQGKRLLWRALDTVVPPLRLPDRRSFRELEALAVDQWQRVDECRRDLAPATLRTVRTPML